MIVGRPGTACLLQKGPSAEQSTDPTRSVFESSYCSSSSSQTGWAGQQGTQRACAYTIMHDTNAVSRASRVTGRRGEQLTANVLQWEHHGAPNMTSSVLSPWSTNLSKLEADDPDDSPDDRST